MYRRIPTHSAPTCKVSWSAAVGNITGTTELCATFQDNSYILTGAKHLLSTQWQDRLSVQEAA